MIWLLVSFGGNTIIETLYTCEGETKSVWELNKDKEVQKALRNSWTPSNNLCFPVVVRTGIKRYRTRRRRLGEREKEKERREKGEKEGEGEKEGFFHTFSFCKFIFLIFFKTVFYWLIKGSS